MDPGVTLIVGSFIYIAIIVIFMFLLLKQEDKFRILMLSAKRKRNGEDAETGNAYTEVNHDQKQHIRLHNRATDDSRNIVKTEPSTGILALLEHNDNYPRTQKGGYTQSDLVRYEGLYYDADDPEILYTKLPDRTAGSASDPSNNSMYSFDQESNVYFEGSVASSQPYQGIYQDLDDATRVYTKLHLSPSVAASIIGEMNINRRI